jgi:RNase H-like domain found in reverse transcriptase
LAKFRQYLGSAEFDLVTDSRAVTYLSTTKNFSAKLARFSLFLSEFNFNIIHKSGVSHGNADGLTRMTRHHDDPELDGPIAEIQEVQQGYLDDTVWHNLVATLEPPQLEFAGGVP